jgi:hypothetical protein
MQRQIFVYKVQTCLLLLFEVNKYTTTLKQCNKMFFRFLLNTEGATEKVSQFKMPQKSDFNTNLGLNKQKM